MSRFAWYFANLLAGSLDLTIGALIGAAMNWHFGLGNPFLFMAYGAFFAVLPDFDIIPQVLARNKVNAAHHQSVLHQPVVVLVVTMVMGAMFDHSLYLSYTTTAVMGLWWHYMHDSRLLGGGGISWLHTEDNPPPPMTDGDPHTEWLVRKWLRPSLQSVIEVSLANVFLCAALVVSETRLPSALALCATITMMVAMFWMSNPERREVD